MSRLTPNSSCKAGLKMAMWCASAVLASARAELRADRQRRLPGVRQHVVDDRREQEEVVGMDRGVMVAALSERRLDLRRRARGRSVRRSRGRGTETVVGGKG